MWALCKFLACSFEKWHGFFLLTVVTRILFFSSVVLVGNSGIVYFNVSNVSNGLLRRQIAEVASGLRTKAFDYNYDLVIVLVNVVVVFSILHLHRTQREA